VVLRKGDKDKHAHCTKCGLGLTTEELAKHMKVFHERLKCECGVELEMEPMVINSASYGVSEYQNVLLYYIMPNNLPVLILF